MVVKLLPLRLIFIILPVVFVLDIGGLLTTWIKYALVCGGMLRVIAFENNAFIVIFTVKSEGEMLFPNSSITDVFRPTTSMMVSSRLRLGGIEYDTVIIT